MTIPLTHARRYELGGIYNLRDTGGYSAATGTTKWGKLLRSDALHRLDDAGRERLAELGLAHVIDLRGVAEREAAQSLLGGLAVNQHHLAAFDEANPVAQVSLDLSLAELYDAIIEKRGDWLADVVRVIANSADDEAVLVHCTAGKDRTGLVIALALAAAGVDRAEIVADYALTEANLRGEWSESMVSMIEAGGVVMTPQLLELVSASPAEVMEGILARIDRDYGSAADYLLAHGLTDDELRMLTAQLIA